MKLLLELNSKQKMNGRCDRPGLEISAAIHFMFGGWLAFLAHTETPSGSNPLKSSSFRPPKSPKAADGKQEAPRSSAE